jgi:hypothetical protein
MPKTKIDLPNANRDLCSGLIRLHVLHHAVEELIFQMAAQLRPGADESRVPAELAQARPS